MLSNALQLPPRCVGLPRAGKDTEEIHVGRGTVLLVLGPRVPTVQE